MIKKLLLLFFIFIFNLFFINKTFADCPYRIVQDSIGFYVVEIDTSNNAILQPYFVKGLKTNNAVYQDLEPRLVVNAGFFDPKNKKTVSYVVINGQVVLNPQNNENLMENIALKPFLDKILNRSEFRILEDEDGQITYDIAPHNQEVQLGYNIKHSIQGGPMLVPDLRLEEEFFILKDSEGKIISESASSLHKYPRTAIGIKENKVYLFLATVDSPMNLEDLSEIAKKWGMEKAMAFDGGGSTSFDSQELHIVSDKDKTARKLKSFLILK